MELKISPAAYQRIVAGCLDREGFSTKYGTQSYIDYIVHGIRDRKRDRQPSTAYQGLGLSCIDDQEQQLRELFAVLDKYKLFLKPDKCKMFVTKVQFRGQILTPFHGQQDAEKVASIERW